MINGPTSHWTIFLFFVLKKLHVNPKEKKNEIACLVTVDMLATL